MRYLGIDYGTKRVGIAFSDEHGRFAFPETVLQNDRELFPRIWDLIKARGVAAIVLGASFDYKGTENPIMKEIKRFKEKLERELDMTVYLEKEILTSAEARRIPQASDVPKSRKPREKRHVDASAAALILQSFLDSRERGNST